MVLLIDNYDSFTYNLSDYIQQLGFACKVIRNDELNLDEIASLNFDAIVLSPGPCTPIESGIMMAVIDRFYTSKPILGICLGHQALGIYFGARLHKAKVPMHGKTSIIEIFNSSQLFMDLGSRMEVMRYHSLILEEVKEPLQVVAKTLSGEVMAIEHAFLPIAGVQFHPESILTKSGKELLKNWFDRIS